MNHGDEQDPALREERRAAAEAAAIGGEIPDSGGTMPDGREDDALHPVYEAGGGEQDGFELAEGDLVRNATHDDGGALPERDRFSDEREADRATIEHAEADDVETADGR